MGTKPGRIGRAVTSSSVVLGEPKTTEGVNPGSTPEQDERDALVLRLAGFIAKDLIKQNPSIESIKRVITNRLPAVFSAVGGIVIEEEPLASHKHCTISQR